jgi:hypothetical protein
MKSWLRLAVALSAFWLFGCVVVLLIELSQLPAGPDCTSQKPPFEAFFRSTKIFAVHVRHPQLGIVAFPSTMSRAEIEEALRRNLPRYYQPTNAPVEWDVAVDKPDDYYNVAFDSHRLLRIAIFPTAAIFMAVLVVGRGTRWVVQGVKT